MAMNLGRKFILKIRRSFVAGVTGGNPRLSSGLARSPRPNAPRPRPNKYPDDPPPLHVTAIKMINLFIPEPKTCVHSFFAIWWFDYIMGGALARNVKYGIKGLGEDMKKTMEENGVSRELWEAKIAQVKEKIKSGSASED